MDQSVALDVSLKEVSVCVLGADGTLTDEGRTASDPASLVGLIQAKAPRAVRIGLETGSISVWLVRALRAQGLPVICLDNPARACCSLDLANQNRPERCPGLGRDAVHGLVPRGAGQAPISQAEPR